jgi:cytochrome c-type biogenesis protein CcmE
MTDTATTAPATVELVDAYFDLWRATDDGQRLHFRVRDRDGSESIPVVYQGVVPDPFRENREIIIEGEMKDGTFVAKRDSLVTKCPSKFKNEQDGDTL